MLDTDGDVWDWNSWLSFYLNFLGWASRTKMVYVESSLNYALVITFLADFFFLFSLSTSSFVSFLAISPRLVNYALFLGLNSTPIQTSISLALSGFWSSNCQHTASVCVETWSVLLQHHCSLSSTLLLSSFLTSGCSAFFQKCVFY